MKDELHINKEDLKIRKSWPDNFDPNEKIHKVKTSYQRQNNKKTIEETLEQEQEDNADLDWLA